MNICTQYLDAYLKDGTPPKQDAWFYQYTKGPVDIASNRQEVCLALFEQLAQYVDFPIWNRFLATTLFPDIQTQCTSITILPIIGSDPKFDAALVSHDAKLYLLVDLLNIADYTPSIKEMSYILHNLCHGKLYQYLFTQKFPLPGTWMELLEYRFFLHGFVQYLSWNTSYDQYVFHHPTYQKKKDTAFTLLARVLTMEDQEEMIPSRLLETLDHVDLWNRFPDVAGLFFLDDLYHDHGEDGILLYFQHGPSKIFQMIFPDLIK